MESKPHSMENDENVTETHFRCEAATFFELVAVNSSSETPVMSILGASQHSNKYSVTCKEIKDEEDIIAIRGVHWREQKQPDTSFILQEILEQADEMCCDADEEVLPKCSNDEMNAESEDEDMSGVEVDAATGETSAYDYSFKLRVPPGINDAHKSLQDLKLLLKLPHDKKLAGSVILSPVLKERLTQVKNFLTTHPANSVSQAADQAAQNVGKAQGVHLPWCLQTWAKAYIKNWTALPHYKQPQKYSHVNDEDFAAELKLHLQSIGKYVHEQDLMKEPHCQYSDGHEQEDIVHYCHNFFIPAWACYQACTYKWKQDDLTIKDTGACPDPFGYHVVVWFHDESTFYVNDWRKNHWVHMMESAVPQPKGEGWPGEHAMDILEKNYSDEDHVLVFDNATTHLKRADDALSARKMPKCLSTTWGVSITKKSDDGRPIIGTDGKPVKEKIWMKDA
ncbi:hypothetical protein DFJ58DRAFT_837130 [Suillus subalutaceus]|uniref:uncharacterized protein n=1 Tax=Suillus subalutaceus TaxID=48586 RepID=UPI001B861920|nr:uncharacterized protein DFJ58DRAFT_837130 [Suillus subalutaceus]KAG1871816.1 hypothetical protein DFJ58DRAFT_837130 [Suillus subalutaceus]